jgi:hypothetical protein
VRKLLHLSELLSTYYFVSSDVELALLSGLRRDFER